MLTDQELHEQLAAYGEWVALRAGGEVVFGSSPPQDGAGARRPTPEFALEDTRHHRRPEHRGLRRSRWLVAASLLLVVAGLAAVTVLRRDSAPASQPERTADPPGALFVLPGGTSGFGVTNGHLSGVRAGSSSSTGNVLVVGTSTGPAFRHLLSVSAGRRPLATNEWDDVELPTGPALVAAHSSVTLVTQRRGTRWLTVQGLPAEAQAALDVFDHVTVAEDGVTSIDPAAGLDIVADVATGAPARHLGTGFELVDAETGDGVDISVETGSTPSPLLPAPVVADEVEPITVRGVPGWRLSRQDPDGEWNAVTWMATPNRAIGVSGHVPFGDIVAAADGLVITDEAAWTAALPDFTQE